MSTPQFAMYGVDQAHTGRCTAVAPAHPVLKWKCPTGSIYAGSAIGADGTIYVGSEAGGIYAVNPNGTVLWKYGSTLSVLNPAIATDGTIYAGTPYAFVALNPNGTLKWSLPFTPMYHPVVGTDGTIYIYSRSNTFYALNPDGTTRWTWDVRIVSSVRSFSTVIAADGTIYVIDDYNCYAINSDGTLKWSYSVWHNPQPALADDGTIYLVSPNEFIALNTDGTLKWQSSIDGGTTALAVGHDGSIYISDYVSLIAYNPNGTVKWRHVAGVPAVSHLVIDAMGTLIVACNGYMEDDANYLCAVNPNGTLRWSVPVCDIDDASPSIGADGTIYLGTGPDDNGAFNAYNDIASSITVTSPNGGESWLQGSNHYVTWTSTGVIGNVNISLYKGGVRDSVLTLNVPNTGVYAWAIPATQTLGTDYKVRVTAVADPTITDDSDANFSIVAPPPSLTVTSPNGGESYLSGSAQTITWTSTGTVANVNLLLYKGGVLNTTLVTDIANTGSWVWAINATQPEGVDYRVVVQDVADPTFSDMSDDNFTITTPPALYITYPTKPGIVFVQGQTYNITWVSVNVPEHVIIQLYKGGLFNTTISDSTPNTGSLYWTVPTAQTPGTDYQVFISAEGHADINTISASDFAIVAPPPSLTVTSPNGGETFDSGSTQTITWTSTGDVGNVSLALYESGALDSVIATNIGNTGSYAWAIPPTQATGTTYRVLIAEVSDGGIDDTSDENFTILQPLPDLSGALKIKLPEGWHTIVPMSVTPSLQSKVLVIEAPVVGLSYVMWTPPVPCTVVLDPATLIYCLRAGVVDMSAHVTFSGLPALYAVLPAGTPLVVTITAVSVAPHVPDSVSFALVYQPTGG